MHLVLVLVAMGHEIPVQIKYVSEMSCIKINTLSHVISEMDVQHGVHADPAVGL